MNYCDNCDICYEEKSCPLCKAIKEKNDLIKQIEDKQQATKNIVK